MPHSSADGALESGGEICMSYGHTSTSSSSSIASSKGSLHPKIRSPRYTNCRAHVRTSRECSTRGYQVNYARHTEQPHLRLKTYVTTIASYRSEASTSWSLCRGV